MKGDEIKTHSWQNESHTKESGDKVQPKFANPKAKTIEKSPKDKQYACHMKTGNNCLWQKRLNKDDMNILS